MPAGLACGSTHTTAENAFDGWRSLLPFMRHAMDASGNPEGRPGSRSEPLVADLSYGRWRDRCFPSPELGR